jgi:hypothetical protein
VVTGNLTVSGTTTTINTTNSTISDSLIELNSGAGSNANDLGFIFERGSTGDNAIIAWDESADAFVMGTTTATGASTGDLTIANGELRLDTLRIDQSGSGLRMTNVGAFDNDGSDNFRIFATNDLKIAANGDSGTAITIDATNQDVTITNDLRVTAGQFYYGGTAVTSTATELNYLDGVTSNIQTQIDGISGGDVVEDTTPQLGGDLDVNGQKITSASNGHIEITPNGTGKVGIGTSSPTGKLHVVGGRSYFASDSDNFAVYLRYNNTTSGFFIGSPSANAMAFSASSGAERMRITSDGDVLIGTTTSSGALTIDADSSNTNNRGLHITVTDDDPTATTTASLIEYNVTGATATGGDTTHIALRVDTDSSATGGDATDEHRVYGIYNTVDVTGDSDAVFGLYNDIRASHSADTISALYGNYTLLESDNSGGTVSTATADRNFMYVNGTGSTTQAYASYNYTRLQDPSTVTTAHGSYNEVQLDTNSTVTTVYGVRSIIDEDGGSSSNEYLFHGSYQGTPSGSGYGLYITGESNNYFSAAVGIGATSPTTSLEINAANTLGATFTGTTAGEGVEVSQTSYTADNYVSLIEGKYLASQAAPHVRIGAQYTGSGSKLVFGTSNSYGSGITNSALTIDPSGNATFSANVTASYLIGTATSALYADLAEKYVADAHYEPGTVMVIGGDKEVTASSSYMDPTVAGVVSTNPAFLMNKDLTAEHVVDLALTGRVPCKVHGIIKRGDMIVSGNIAGVGTSCTDPKFGTVVGKALENYNSKEVGIIEVIAGRL